MADDIHNFKYAALKKLSDGLIWLDKGLTRKKLTVFAVIIASVLLIALGVNIYNSATMTPFEYVEDSLKDTVFSPDELLCEATDGGYTLVFYCNSSDAAYCAVLKDTLFGYKTVRISGGHNPKNAIRFSDPENLNKSETYLGSNLSTAKNPEDIGWLYWGLAIDDTYGSTGDEIYLGDMKCRVTAPSSASQLRVFWTIDPQKDVSFPKMRIVPAP